MSANGPPILEVLGLRKSFGHTEVLRGIDLAVAPRELVFVIGPSGSGKSTLLRCCNRLEEPTGGEVRIEGENICAPGVDINRVRQRIGFVFQSFNLYPHMNALGNVTVALRKVQGRTRAEAEERGMAALRQVGLAEKASCRAVSSSASRSRARSRSSRTSCSSTSRPARSTRSSSAASSW